MESKKWRTNSTYHWMKSAHKDNMAPGQSHAEWHKQHMNKPILHFEIEAPNVQLNPTTTKQLSPWLQFNWGTWRYNLFTSPTIDANSQIWMQDEAPIGLPNGFGIHGIQGTASNLDTHDERFTQAAQIWIHRSNLQIHEHAWSKFEPKFDAKIDSEYQMITKWWEMKILLIKI